MYMLDTDLCIYIINEKTAVLQKKLNRHVGHVCISSITLAELFFGVENSKRREANLAEVLEFAANLSVLPFDETAAMEYGQARAALQQAGQLIGSNDMLIAAHALGVDATLVTNNVKEFSRVKGLRVENWAKGKPR